MRTERRMVENLLVLWFAAIPLMASPGPATLSVAAVGAAYGLRRGRSYFAGIVAGTAGVLVLVATGVTALIATVPALLGVLTVVGVSYMLYLAYRIATAPLNGAADGVRAPSFVGGLVLALANPKAYAAIGALLASYEVMPGTPVADAAAKVVALTALVIAINGFWFAFGSQLMRLRRDPVRGRVINVALALMLLAAVGAVVVAGLSDR